MDTSDLKVCMSHLFSEQERIFNEWINKKISDVAEKIHQEYCIPKDEILNMFEINETEVLSCQYVLTRGAKSGSICGKKPKKGCKYCSVHMKKVKIPEKSDKKLVLRKHTFFKDLFFHKETGFLVKSKAEGVIGKIDEDDDNEDEEPKIVKLSSADIEKCKELGLRVKDQVD